MDNEVRTKAIHQIRENIERSGYHLYVVSGGQIPRFAYTIGLSPKLGRELIFAGGITFMYREVSEIVDAAAELLKRDPMPISQFSVNPYGAFHFSECDPSWTNELMPGAADYFQNPNIPGLQILPDARHWTVDIPDMSRPFSAEAAPVWKWLRERWRYLVPAEAHATTDLRALRGEQVTEACRWEEDYWELFAGSGPDTPKDQTRVVGLGTLLAIDSSLEPILELGIDDGIWREKNSNWQVWKRSP